MPNKIAVAATSSRARGSKRTASDRLFIAHPGLRRPYSSVVWRKPLAPPSPLLRRSFADTKEATNMTCEAYLSAWTWIRERKVSYRAGLFNRPIACVSRRVLDTVLHFVEPGSERQGSQCYTLSF